jgi:hypothetical protein
LRRRLVSLLVLLLALAAAGSATAAEPSPRAMVLTTDDFGPGATVLYQGKKIAPVFAPVVAGMPISDRYSRTLGDVALGALKFPQVYSSAFVVTSNSELATLVNNLKIATVPGAARRAFIEGMQSGAGSDVSLTLVRARTLKLGDTAVELILHLKGAAGAFDLVEIWIRKGHAVSAVAVVTPRPLNAGQSFSVGKIVARHLKTAAP